MTAGLRTLLNNILDYAGLFPPAALPLDEAIRNYAAYLKTPDRWMLSRFICPTVRLHEVGDYLPKLFSPPNESLTISALGRSGKDAMDFIANLETDLLAVRAFRDMAGDKATVDVIETRVFDNPSQNDEILNHVAASCDSCKLRGFLEVPVTEAGIAAASQLAKSFATSGLGYKLRTGGTEAVAFPTSNAIAKVIIACRDAKCPIKFTAGLHHPIRVFHKSVNAMMHGFINVFAAGVLALTHSMDVHGIAEVLSSESAADFSFDEYGLRWKTLNATRQRIEQVRTSGLISFGSCSFDEPRDDLKSLGWM